MIIEVILRRKIGLIVRSIVYAIALPGMGIIAVPYIILRWSDSFKISGSVAILLVSVGSGIVSISALIYCIWCFIRHGNGTLAPIDAPKQLVVQGLYRYTRNPMYLSVVGTLMSEALFFESTGLLFYAGIVFILFHAFVVFYEEPKLKELFGQAYPEYCQVIPRWGIRICGTRRNRTRNRRKEV